MTTIIESKTGLLVAFQADQLVREPGDGVGLPAARRVLDKVPLPRAASFAVGQELPDHIQLVVPGEDLLRFFFPVLGSFSVTICAYFSMMSVRLSGVRIRFHR